jgi:hypothetical protein
VAEALDAGEVGKVVGGDLDPLGLALEDVAQRLAHQPRDFAFQRAHAGFARVEADERAQPLLGQRELAVLEAVVTDLLGDQMRCAISTFSSSV